MCLCKIAQLLRAVNKQINTVYKLTINHQFWKAHYMPYSNETWTPSFSLTDTLGPKFTWNTASETLERQEALLTLGQMHVCHLIWVFE